MNAESREDMIEDLQCQMICHINALFSEAYSDEKVDAFIDNVVQLQLSINNISTSDYTTCLKLQLTTNSLSKNNVNDNHTSPLPNRQHSDINFSEYSLLPIYYNNVRYITNKKNICMRIELSLFKILCFTETWLTSLQSSSVYFPSQFNVYRCDRIAASRRSGGVAILVHSKYHSRQIKLERSPQCECLAIEVKLKPISLIIYLVYMREFNTEIANEHYKNIKYLISNFSLHRLMVIGDFNLHDIRWINDDSDTHYVPTDNLSHKTSYFREATEFLIKLQMLSLYQLSNIKNKASNVLDLVFVNEINDIKLCEENCGIIESSQQDVYHKPYEITFEYCPNQSSQQSDEIEIFSYKKGNYERMCLKLNTKQHKFST